MQWPQMGTDVTVSLLCSPMFSEFSCHQLRVRTNVYSFIQNYENLLQSSTSSAGVQTGLYVCFIHIDWKSRHPKNCAGPFTTPRALAGARVRHYCHTLARAQHGCPVCSTTPKLKYAHETRSTVHLWISLVHAFCSSEVIEPCAYGQGSLYFLSAVMATTQLVQFLLVYRSYTERTSVPSKHAFVFMLLMAWFANEMQATLDRARDMLPKQYPQRADIIQWKQRKTDIERFLGEWLGFGNLTARVIRMLNPCPSLTKKLSLLLKITSALTYAKLQMCTWRTYASERPYISKRSRAPTAICCLQASQRLYGGMYSLENKKNLCDVLEHMGYMWNNCGVMRSAKQL